MAGRGSRFLSEGFDIPKPLLKVVGIPMVIRALSSLRRNNNIRLIVVALEEHDASFQLHELFKNYGYEIELVLIKNVTRGQLCTVLCAEHLITENTSLLVVPSDTYVDSNILDEIESLEDGVAGLISVYNLPGDRWSFARTDDYNNVVEVAEKVRISNFASTGLYFFSDSEIFFKYSNEIILNNELTSGEFYVIPVYNKYIKNGEKVRISLARAVYDMGTPDAKFEVEELIKNSNLGDI